MNPDELWAFLGLGYVFTVLVETPILLAALSSRHPWKVRLFCGVWLTACTYPIVILVLPMIINPTELRWLYLLVAESFAPLAECALFWAAFGKKEEAGKRSMWQDFAAITAANLASFGLGELMHHFEWFGWFDRIVKPGA
jgi:hypothetical protein